MQTNSFMQESTIRAATIYLKAITYTLLIALLTGFVHPLFLGFHPILQGLILGLIAGTIAGKLFSIHDYKLHSSYEGYLVALGLLLAFVAGQWIGVSLAFDHNNWSFLFTTWKLDEFRDMIQWKPVPNTGDYVDPVDQGWWLFWFIADALLFYVVSYLTLRLASRVSRKKPTTSEWPVYRMLALFGFFILSLYFFSKDSIGQNLRNIATWKQELWADSMVAKVYRNIEGIVSNGLTPEAFALEDVTEAMQHDDQHPFPEGHLLLALQHLREETFYLASADIDRAIYQAQSLKRRVTLENGERIDADQFLAHLYHFRAKLLSKTEKDLLAERNLILAIQISEEAPASESKIPDTGFYAHEAQILGEAGYLPQFGLAACYYERSLIRLNLDADQAEKDRQKALSLGFNLPKQES